MWLLTETWGHRLPNILNRSVLTVFVRYSTLQVALRSETAEEIDVKKYHKVRAGRLFFGLLAAIGLSCFVAVSPASAGSGNVMCANQATVVGVWVDVNGGTDGWATRTGSGYSQGWSYNTQGKSYSLHVGCGGTPQNWASNNKTPYYSNWGSVICFPGWSYGLGTVWVKDRCYAG